MVFKLFFANFYCSVNCMTWVFEFLNIKLKYYLYVIPFSIVINSNYYVPSFLSFLFLFFSLFVFFLLLLFYFFIFFHLYMFKLCLQIIRLISDHVIFKNSFDTGDYLVVEYLERSNHQVRSVYNKIFWTRKILKFRPGNYIWWVSKLYFLFWIYPKFLTIFILECF